MSTILESALDPESRRLADANDTPVTIRLADGKQFDFRRPDGHMWDHVTIAHALSQLCRFTGNTLVPYSVAQHSVLASYAVPPEFAFQALMHDAHESVTGDMSGPLKQLCPDFCAVERRCARALRRFYHLPEVCDPLVKAADDLLLRAELARVMPPSWEDAAILGSGPKDWRVSMFVWSPAEAKARFLVRFGNLRPS